MIVRIRLDELHRVAASKPDPAAYVAAHEDAAVEKTDTHLRLERSAYDALRLKLNPPAKGSKLTQLVRVARAGGRAARSVAKTSLGIDRVTDTQVEARLGVCRACPGGHAVMKDGEVHTCGPMLESMRDAGLGTCGCILRKKARDRKEDCPFGWWPTNGANKPEGSA